MSKPFKRSNTLFKPMRDGSKRPTEDDDDFSVKRGVYRIRTFGLENNRFFCYYNSCLQCIFNLKQVREFYLDSKYKRLRVKNP